MAIGVAIRPHDSPRVGVNGSRQMNYCTAVNYTNVRYQVPAAEFRCQILNTGGVNMCASIVFQDNINKKNDSSFLWILVLHGRFAIRNVLLP